MKFINLLILATILILPLCSLAQKSNSQTYTYLPKFEFKLESGITQLLVKGDYSLKLDSAISSNLPLSELIKHSEHRNAKPGFFIGAAIDYRVSNKFSVGIVYAKRHNLKINETGSISSIKIIGSNIITTQASGYYIMNSKLENSTFMVKLSSNLFITKKSDFNIVFNYGLSAGYSNIKPVTYVPNAIFNLSMDSEMFQPQDNLIGSISNQEMNESTYSWSLFSNVTLEFLNAPNISLGYNFTRLGEIKLIERAPESVNLIEAYVFNNEQNSNTEETLTLITTNNKLKLFSHNFSISISF